MKRAAALSAMLIVPALITAAATAAFVAIPTPKAVVFIAGIASAPLFCALLWKHLGWRRRWALVVVPAAYAISSVAAVLGFGAACTWLVPWCF